jgi:hypothetical protein
MNAQIAWQNWTIILGGISTLAIFSFLWRENPLYRFFEHIFIGISVGWGVILGFRNFLWPKVFAPILYLDAVQYPDGTFAAPYATSNLLFIVPILFGSLIYFVYSKRHGWLAKLVIGFLLGLSGGTALEEFCNLGLPLVFAAFVPLVVFKPIAPLASEVAISWGDSLSNFVFLGTLFTVMYYFFFSLRGRSEVLTKISSGGRWLMMVCFGAYFGSTVMARMALLVERLQFLIHDWTTALRGVL